MIEINLIPDVKREYLKTRSLRNLVISISIITGLGTIGLAVALGIIFAGQVGFGVIQDGDIKREGEKLTSISDLNKTVTIQQQLDKIDQQHEGKNINSRLFDVMRAINPPAPNNVSISSMRMDPENNTLHLEGAATNGYIALEVLKKTISNTSVQVRQDGEDVKVPLTEAIEDGETGFGENTEGRRVLRFSFSFTYPDELFSASNGAVSIVTPRGKVDVTDSKLGVPESLFSKRVDDSNSSGSDD